MKTGPTNVRLSEKTLSKIKVATDISGESAANIMRHAMDLGLSRLESVGYDVQKMIEDGVSAAESMSHRHPLQSLPAPKQDKANSSRSGPA